MKRILSAELLRYNANTAGNRAPDCVKRAISYAFDKSYVQVSKDLNAKMKEKKYDQWNIPQVYGLVIRAYGGSSRGDINDFDPEFTIRTTLNEFADKYNTGSYILEVGKKDDSKISTHLVAVVDGQVVDSWDSRNWYVKHVYATGHAHAAKTDLWSSDNVQHLLDLSIQAVTVNANNQIRKITEKYGWELSGLDIDGWSGNYNITVPVALWVRWAEGKEGRKMYSMDIKFVFTPTTTIEEAEKYIKTNAYTRVYDRFYEIVKRVSAKAEEQKVQNELRTDPTKAEALEKQSMFRWMDGRERAFYNSLPGSIRARIVRINIQNPGQYSDSYDIQLIPKDERSNSYNGKYVDFEAYDAASMKDMLMRYETKGEIPFEDYDPREEY